MQSQSNEKPSHNRLAAFAFGTHQITVSSPVDKIVARISRSFRAFDAPASSPGAQEDRFEVLPIQGGYTIRKNGTEMLRAPSFREAHRQLRHAVIHTFVDARPDLLWLHAGGAAFERQAVVLAGAYGRGKSTLVAGLCQQGWDYLSDDIVPIDLANGTALPFPLSPNRRLGNGTVLSPKELGTLQRQRIEISSEQIARHPRPVGALIFPKYEPDAPPTFAPYAPGAATLELLRRCLNFKKHQREAVSYLSQLVHRFPSFELCHPGDPAAARLIVEAFQDGRFPAAPTP